MSGEYCEIYGAYFHNVILDAAETHLSSDNLITRKYGRLLKEISPAIKAIAWFEASDTGEDYPLGTTIDQLPKIAKALKELQYYIAPIAELVEQAKLDAIEEFNKKS